MYHFSSQVEFSASWKLFCDYCSWGKTQWRKNIENINVGENRVKKKQKTKTKKKKIGKETDNNKRGDILCYSRIWETFITRLLALSQNSVIVLHCACSAMSNKDSGNTGWEMPLWHCHKSIESDKMPHLASKKNL